MLKQDRLFTTAWQRIFAICLSFSLAASAFAAPYAAGESINAFSLEDQHGEQHKVDIRVTRILFSRDMDGADLIEQGLIEMNAANLKSKGIVYVADISGMPGLVASMFAIPAMQDMSYPILLDRDGNTTARLPGKAEQATLIFLDKLTITRVIHTDDAATIQAELN